MPDRAADSARCMGVCAHLSTMPLRKLMIEKEQWPSNNSPDLNTMETSYLGSDTQSYFETYM